MAKNKKETIRACLYEFMGYCSARYNTNKDIALTAEDVKIVEQYVKKLLGA